jgi:hypothetical protein
MHVSFAMLGHRHPPPFEVAHFSREAAVSFSVGRNCAALVPAYCPLLPAQGNRMKYEQTESNVERLVW